MRSLSDNHRSSRLSSCLLSLSSSLLILKVARFPACLSKTNMRDLECQWLLWLWSWPNSLLACVLVLFYGSTSSNLSRRNLRPDSIYRLASVLYIRSWFLALRLCPVSLRSASCFFRLIFINFYTYELQTLILVMCLALLGRTTAFTFRLPVTEWLSQFLVF